MKTIFIVSRKPDFTASRLMEEPALMSHGYICCGIYRVYELVEETPVFVGQMGATEVMECISKEVMSYKIEKLPGTASSCCVHPFTDDPQIMVCKCPML